MSALIVYTLACYGLSSALVYYGGPFGVISRFRDLIASSDNLNSLFSCMFCLPVNIGFLMSIVSLVFAPMAPFTPFTALLGSSLWPIAIVLDGFYTGAAVSIIDTVVERITPKDVN